jgi:hypothetical protein
MITTINEFKVYFINEASFDQLQNQFVNTNKITDKIFDEIKLNINKSAYATWLITKILNKIILSEDIYKYKDYFLLFDRYKREYKYQDINKYKTKQDLKEFIEKSVEIKNRESEDVSSIKGISKNEKYKQFEIGVVDGFTVYELPKDNLNNYNVSCELGSGTEWCTSTGNTNTYYDNYIKKDSLFIFIKGNEKYQFHYESESFMDKNDNSMIKNDKLNVNLLFNLFEFINNKYPKYIIPFKIKAKANKLINDDYINATEKEWDEISRYQKISEEFIKKHKDKLNWYNISMYQKLSESFITEFKDLVHWTNISIYQNLSESFIRKYKDLVSWTHISQYQKLSEEFISEHKKIINWYNILEYQNLSESFIIKHKDKAVWYLISAYQNISYEFINKFKNKLTVKYLLDNKHLSDELKEKIKKIYNL